MKVDSYKLFCSSCHNKDEEGYVVLKASDVHITVNLHNDNYEIFGICPRCNDEISNTRKAFLNKKRR